MVEIAFLSLLNDLRDVCKTDQNSSLISLLDASLTLVVILFAKTLGDAIGDTVIHLETTQHML